MSYDPFRWADNFSSEEEYLQELLEKQSQYPQCEHISKKISEILNKGE